MATVNPFVGSPAAANVEFSQVVPELLYKRTSRFANPDIVVSFISARVSSVATCASTYAVVASLVELLDYSDASGSGVGTNWKHIVKNAPVPAGGSLMVIAGQKIVLEERAGGTGDAIRITSSAATSLDVVAAILEDVNP